MRGGNLLVVRFAFLIVLASVLGAAERQPVLVELFTSEGCSSCPPADRLLQALERSQPIAGAQVIALSEHVDYWNSAGWRDPFSKAQFSQRQADYARAFNLASNYTPQMVVDGRSEFVGSSAGKASEAIARAARTPKADVDLHWDAGKLMVRVTHVPAGRHWKVLVAVAESGLQSSVAGGENGGRTLGHTAVVRWLHDAGSVRGGQFQGDIALALAKDWKLPNLAAVAFVQDAATKEIAGAAAVGLAAATP